MVASKMEEKEERRKESAIMFRKRAKSTLIRSFCPTDTRPDETTEVVASWKKKK